MLKLSVRKEAAPFTCRTPASTYTTRYTSDEADSALTDLWNDRVNGAAVLDWS